MMDHGRGVFACAAVFLLLVVLGAGHPFISGDALEGHGSTGRSLLQATTSCPINFEFMNYTIITNKCKGPQYPVEPCCSAFKEFACPYVDEINDLTNDCASTMFTYINGHGYPTGLFSYECREGKLGLNCTAYLKETVNSTSSAGAFGALFPPLGLALGFALRAADREASKKQDGGGTSVPL
ncbi:hypothetical protein HPP92_017984 [Vanilla planifolia]|uniref:GPI-anchored protein LLG1-like domain-containing protein n=1 Tax=Vanilla planifolia TaxID=51239 RepID=A0A835UKD7_VANPL|nr:hypothetical protein HPP92_017984 [Vanilla planifolia]